MEFLEGESLRQVFDRRGALPVPEVEEILQQAARGLSAAHKLGIIHRQLDPVNIFLTYPDDEAAPRVDAHDAKTDIVRTLSYHIPDIGRAQDPPDGWLSSDSLFRHCPCPEPPDPDRPSPPLSMYWSYEQIIGMRDNQLDARSDIYSLGVVVYEMLTGRHPFQADTPLGYCYKQLTEEPQPFRTGKPDFPALPGLESAVMKALAKDRDQRYSSVLKFSQAFVQAADQRHPRI